MDIFALNSLLIVSLSVLRLSDARARARRTGANSVFKTKTACQDGPLYKNGNARVNLWHL